MAIIKFPTPNDQNPEFFKDVLEDGHHVSSIKNAKMPNYYPSKFPEYPGVKLSDLKRLANLNF